MVSQLTSRSILVILSVALLSSCESAQFGDGSPTLPVLTSPATTTALQEAGHALDDGRLAAAESRYSELLTVQPSNADAAIGLGETYLALGEWQKASDTFAGVTNVPHHASARQGQAIALMRLGRNEEAKNILEGALEQNPKLWRAHNALALLHEARGETAAAHEHFQKASEINPKSAIVYNNLGYLMLNQRAYSEAIVLFERALSHDPKLVVARNNSRLAKAWQGRYAESIAGASNSEISDILNDVGYIAMLRRDFDVAEAYFVRAMEARPSYFERAARNLSQLRALISAAAQKP